jgi:hypothetical protein
MEWLRTWKIIFMLIDCCKPKWEKNSQAGRRLCLQLYSIHPKTIFSMSWTRSSSKSVKRGECHNCIQSILRPYFPCHEQEVYVLTWYHGEMIIRLECCWAYEFWDFRFIWLTSKYSYSFPVLLPSNAVSWVKSLKLLFPFQRSNLVRLSGHSTNRGLQKLA